MSEAASTEFEALLRRALAPVEPPAELVTSLEETLTSIAELAADELDAWEIGAMRDPRNWVRPVVASAVGVTAGTALVVLRVRAERKKRAAASSNPLDLLRRTVKAAAGEAKKLARRD